MEEKLDIVWTIGLWAAFAYFVFFESRAYFFDKQMLTHYVRVMTAQWPWVPYLMGVGAVVLAWHFWVEK